MPQFARVDVGGLQRTVVEARDDVVQLHAVAMPELGAWYGALAGLESAVQERAAALGRARGAGQGHQARGVVEGAVEDLPRRSQVQTLKAWRRAARGRPERERSHELGARVDDQHGKTRSYKRPGGV